MGLIVDAAREFLRIPEETVRPIEQTLTGISGNYLKAVANLGERLLLLDLDAVLDVDLNEPAPQTTAPVTAQTSLPLSAPTTEPNTT